MTDDGDWDPDEDADAPETIVRIDAVTLRFFEAIGRTVDHWLTQLKAQPSPFGSRNGPRIYMQRGAGNPCGEIPMEPMSDIDLLSYRYARDRRKATHEDGRRLPTGRIMGGKLHIGSGVVYSAPGDAFDEMREQGRLTVPQSFPTTILHGMVGSPATQVADSPLLEGCIVTDAASEAGEGIFTISVEWLAITARARVPA